MTPQPALSDDTLPAPAFAQRVALSVLALEIDELLRRSGGDAFASRPASPSGPTASPPDSLQPQTARSS